MLLTRLLPPFIPQTRPFFHWLDIVFNRVDEERRKIVGPDRSCAEWLLRNGAHVKWEHCNEFLTDYNKLPSDRIRLHLVEVYASEASIMHYGFDHFVGCEHIRKIIFHKCYHLENEALKGLTALKNSLLYLQITECLNITESGLIHLNTLNNLKELILADLPYIKEKEKILDKLQHNLPHCTIQFH
ncbi:ATP synthase subunit s, mitochondrial [Tribolium madens]|uniref:ATP synthase subunit s, mitochondrial n=1 Tax=Tribolium madens TaxID=41895 RepID=UPI001CF74D70|nr:ATP synthase subunit s, mitochondrial [Tribolium madens]